MTWGMPGYLAVPKHRTTLTPIQLGLSRQNQEELNPKSWTYLTFTHSFYILKTTITLKSTLLSSEPTT
jgi:hypothetical protein